MNEKENIGEHVLVLLPKHEVRIGERGETYISVGKVGLLYIAAGQKPNISMGLSYSTPTGFGYGIQIGSTWFTYVDVSMERDTRVLKVLDESCPIHELDGIERDW